MFRISEPLLAVRLGVCGTVGRVGYPYPYAIVFPVSPSWRYKMPPVEIAAKKRMEQRDDSTNCVTTLNCVVQMETS